ncbi:MAG: peptidylprolyl isomerase A [Proteobacteria bacterium]|nr:MAG: peptidylprolyl isomerase A [Pseudomonadota bacterium]
MIRRSSRTLAALALAIATLMVGATARAADPQPEAKPAAKTEGGSNVVVLETTLGNIEIELDAQKAPVSTENFLAYVDAGHYDGTVFHRVIPGFMIQGGGFDAQLDQKPTRGPIQNESGNGLTNQRGTIAMARTNDPNSATAQFFINTVDNDFLNRPPGYAVFGKVTAGMDVVDKIAAVKTGSKGMFPKDVPVEAVVITKARRK